MAFKKSTEVSVQDVVAEILAMEAEANGDAWEHETIDDIENEMVRIGDLVAREIGRRKLARHLEEVKDDRCPACGQTGDPAGTHDRELVTRRGKVAVSEAKYHCRKCRRDFFPSDGAVGD
jgi:transposase